MSVVIRKVRTVLQSEYRKAGGIPIHQAIDQAQQNLTGLADECLERIDVVIGILTEMTADPARRPAGAELRKMHGFINEMLACCATIEIAGFADTLYALGRLVGALMTDDVWLDGSLTPAVSLLRLVRRGAVAPSDLRILIAGIDQCAIRVSDKSPSASEP